MSQHRFAHDVTVDGVRGRGDNIFLAALAGFIMASVGAGIWMLVHLVYLALGVGLLVGLGVRFAGNGRGAIFGLIALIFTAAGCLTGEVLARIQAATSVQRDFYETLTNTDLTQMVTAIFTQTDTVGYVIYGISLVGAYILAMRV